MEKKTFNIKESASYKEYLRDVENEKKLWAKDVGWTGFFSTQTWVHYYRSPCFKQSVLTGLGCSAIMVSHQARLFRSAPLAIAMGLTSFFSTNFFTYQVCEDATVERDLMIRYVFRKSNIKPAPPKGVEDVYDYNNNSSSSDNNHNP